MTATSIERGRITARVPTQVQETLEMAASMVGATVSTNLLCRQHCVKLNASLSKKELFASVHSMRKLFSVL